MSENYNELTLKISNNFEEAKQIYIDRLTFLASHILFPETTISHMQNYKRTFPNGLVDKMIEYNECILKSKDLLNKLKLLQKWGLFRNSHVSWRYSVVLVTVEYRFIKRDIIQLSDPINDVSRIIYTMYNVNQQNLREFMHIVTDETGQMKSVLDKMTLVPDNYDPDAIINEQYVEKLLPKCDKDTSMDELIKYVVTTLRNADNNYENK